MNAELCIHSYFNSSDLCHSIAFDCLPSKNNEGRNARYGSYVSLAYSTQEEKEKRPQHPMSLVDPNKLTVAKLKSALSENGFSDRLHGQKLKADYVQLYKELVVPKLKEKESEEENKEKRKKRGNEENLKENSQEDPPVRRSSRRQTLASLPRAPMTPLATASTPKRVAKRSSSRQSMLPAKRKNIELEEESQEEVHENVELKKEQVEGDVEESSSEDSKDAEEQDKLIELLPPVLKLLSLQKIPI